VEAAVSLFQQLKSGGYACIAAMLGEKRSEDLHLDFKTVDKGGPPLTANDRRTIAKAVSGFCNADGGVIVWGVYAAKGADGADVAQELRPIPSLARFHSDLENLVPQLVTPGPDGVLHWRIEEPTTPDTGLVLTLVPRGEGEPVMATAKDQHNYFQRAGASTQLMEHYQIADRFLRRPQPRIAFDCFAVPSGGGGGPRGRYASITVVFGIRNEGRGVAMHPMLVFAPQRRIERDSAYWSGGAPGLPERLDRRPSDRFPRKVFASTGLEVIHPGTALQVHSLVLNVREGYAVDVEPFDVTYEVYCDGHAVKGTHTVTTQELVAIRDAYFAERP
jgi:hypothetical protein